MTEFDIWGYVRATSPAPTSSATRSRPRTAARQDQQAFRGGRRLLRRRGHRGMDLREARAAARRDDQDDRPGGGKGLRRPDRGPDQGRSRVRRIQAQRRTVLPGAVRPLLQPTAHVSRARVARGPAPCGRCAASLAPPVCRQEQPDGLRGPTRTGEAPGPGGVQGCAREAGPRCRTAGQRSPRSGRCGGVPIAVRAPPACLSRESVRASPRRAAACRRVLIQGEEGQGARQLKEAQELGVGGGEADHGAGLLR
ncbi:hypothetical protein EDD91_0364 [Streptomyces sp. KS 21]|nr:hypothetical protein EDD91_0364 [Streptomyces sp. KS 21]